jgi:hypothetical protein
MAPAQYIPNFRKQQHNSKSPLKDIVHGWSDDVIPVENSIQFARLAGCTLHLISGDHVLNGVVDEVEVLFVRFLSRVFANLADSLS